MAFQFVDLFAGIGGFHAAVSALGGDAVLASEIDPAPARIYEKNWGLKPHGDVRDLAADAAVSVPQHDVLVGGFPCQPFSKSGFQRGISELRGQMFAEILKILKVHRPAVVMLENVRNIAGPRQRHVWDAIVQGLREAGYRTPSEPCVFTPHFLSPELGGAPQTRDRVYILGTYVGRERALRETDITPVVARAPSVGWDPQKWDLSEAVMEEEHQIPDRGRYALNPLEEEWIAVWNDFLRRIQPHRLPGFPLWSEFWHDAATVNRDDPLWKQRFEELNIDFYRKHRGAILGWLRANPQLRSFPASRQKLEWQAGDTAPDLRLCLLHMRPSGIRVKKMSYAPALVAMAQTPVLGPVGRRMTVREAARLQRFPEWFDFGDQAPTTSYKQLGNAVHTGVVYHVLRQHILRDREDIESLCPELVAAAVKSPPAIPAIEKPQLSPLPAREREAASA